MPLHTPDNQDDNKKEKIANDTPKIKHGFTPEQLANNPFLRLVEFVPINQFQPKDSKKASSAFVEVFNQTREGEEILVPFHALSIYDGDPRGGQPRPIPPRVYFSDREQKFRLTGDSNDLGYWALTTMNALGKTPVLFRYGLRCIKAKYPFLDEE